MENLKDQDIICLCALTECKEKEHFHFHVKYLFFIFIDFFQSINIEERFLQLLQHFFFFIGESKFDSERYNNCGFKNISIMLEGGSKGDRNGTGVLVGSTIGSGLAGIGVGVIVGVLLMIWRRYKYYSDTTSK